MISTLDREGGMPGPTEGRDLARQLGAGRYVTGELLEAGGHVQLSAYLHDVEESESTAQASAEGDTDELFDLFDELAVELLAGSMSAQGHRLEALAALTTPSIDAAKAYLEGERLMRGGMYREAAASYDAALAEDSLFPLAHYRKSIAADWIDAHTARTDAERAAQFSDRLPPRDRALVEALRLRRNGRTSDSEQAFRAILHQYPDDVEALVQLGELYFHDNPRRGRPMGAAMAPFRRVLELEPANPIAQVHAARIYALNDSIARLQEGAEYLGRIAGDSERAIEVRAILAYLTGDTATQEQVKQQLSTQPWYYTFHVAHGVGRFARDPAGAADILAARPADDPLLLSLIPSQQIVRGQYEAAFAFLDQMRSEANATWDIFQAFLLTSGAIPFDEARMLEMVQILANTTSTQIRQTAWLDPYEDITDRFLDFQTDFYRALLLIQLGRSDEAEPIIAGMEGQEDFVGLGTAKADALHSLQAELLYAAGDREGALEALRAMRLEVPHALTYQPLADHSRARFLRGQLEWEVGDPTAAQAFLVGLDEPWSVWDTYHRPLLYRLMGEIAEEENRPLDARKYYSRLLRLWEASDPALSPEREDVAERLAALGG